MPKTHKQHTAPGTTPETRQNQLISLAVGLAEQQLMDGTASSQVITHYLKLGTTNAKLDSQILESKVKLLDAKTDQITSSAKQEELYANALAAMRTYGGHDDD